jgi:hypothetical protein
VKNLFNNASSARIVFDGLREITLEPGANLVEDALLELPTVAALIASGVLRERALPSADQDLTGELPNVSSSLTEAAALRAIGSARPNDLNTLRAWRETDPRPAVRSALDSAIRNKFLMTPGHLLDV